MPRSPALLVLLAAPGALAFPFVASLPGVDSSMLSSRSASLSPAGDPICPYNPDHEPAVPFNSKFPYNYAKDGLPGRGIGGYPVPAPGDTAHEFREPGPLDIRGPCPGLNTAANHGFLARDGITSFEELVDAQQNVYNVGYGLAVVLATAGVSMDGDLLGTGKLSLGCDATNRTEPAGASSSTDEPGLDAHNRFEADVSLTRNDYDLTIPNDYKYNNTLFTMMMETCKGNCSIDTLSTYRYKRWEQSEHDNGNFTFAVGQVLLYGAASFLYELFPTAGSTGTGDEATMMSFFGAGKDADGKYYMSDYGRLPPNWAPRVDTYNLINTAPQILGMYLQNPVPFGMNEGRNNFVPLDFTPYIKNGKLVEQTPEAMLCMLFHAAIGDVPLLGGKSSGVSAAVQKAAKAKLAPIFAPLVTCPTI